MAPHEGAVEETTDKQAVQTFEHEGNPIAQGDGDPGTPAAPTTVNTPPRRQMTKTEKDLAELDAIYAYHGPNADQLRRYEHLRWMARALAQSILSSCPPSRERALALTHVQTASMFANASIAIHEAVTPVPAQTVEQSDK